MKERILCWLLWSRLLRPGWAWTTPAAPPPAATSFASVSRRRQSQLQLQSRPLSPFAQSRRVAAVAPRELSAASSSSSASTPASAPKAAAADTTPLVSVLARQRAVLDGPELQTLQAALGRPVAPSATAAAWTVVVGATADGTRVVGVLADDGRAATTAVPNGAAAARVYTDSLARLPAAGPGAAPGPAVATMLHALTHVHACLPPPDAPLARRRDWRVVVVGGGDLARTARRALAEGFGLAGTTIVTTRRGAGAGPETLPPAVGELELGFGQVLGSFDVLLDTIGDEFCDQKSSVVRLLQERHNCGRYLSTRTRSQEVVTDDGLLFGPNQAKEYVRRVQERVDLPPLVPPAGFGATVETLLEKGLLFKYPDGSPQQTYVRSWSLQKYWEATTWPRDSTGGANIRFGFPVPEDLDDIEERFMINEPPARQAPVLVEETDYAEEADREAQSFLLNVVGVSGLQSQIIEPQVDCLLFMSAPFCRTCRYLSPQYLRMARLGQGSGVAFAKANATGKAGKELGKVLDVDSVPTFLLFRKGRLFGKPLSVSRLPSKKLQLAVDMLREGSPWDEAKIREADEKPKQ